MSYERQRAAALRMVSKYGAKGSLVSTVAIPDVEKPWNSTVAEATTPIYFVAFADDGVTFVDHNIQGDVRLLTVVADTPLKINVGDVITTVTNNFSVKKAKPLDPDTDGAILWAALVQ